MHKVQSVLPVIVGTYSPVSHPGKNPLPFWLMISASGMNAARSPAVDSSTAVSRPYRHGLCTQERHTSGSTATICVGETLAKEKLKFPSGHTYLQNVPAGKSVSMRNTVPKYPSAIQAVMYGLAHKLNTSYDTKKASSTASTSHLLRKKRGHSSLRGRNFSTNRVSPRVNIRGQAAQNRLPMIARAMTSNPR